MHIKEGQKFTDIFKVGYTVLYNFYHHGNRFAEQPKEYVVLKVTAKQMRVREISPDRWQSEWTIKSCDVSYVWPSVLQWKKEKLAWLIQHKIDLKQQLSVCEDTIESLTTEVLTQMAQGELS